MHFFRLQKSERATCVFFFLHGKRRSQSLRDQAVMVGNPAGVVGLKKKQRRRRKKKSSPAQASEAMTETSKRQLEIENTFAPAAASHT